MTLTIQRPNEKQRGVSVEENACEMLVHDNGVRAISVKP
jgi:hypothetical protein